MTRIQLIRTQLSMIQIPLYLQEVLDNQWNLAGLLSQEYTLPIQASKVHLGWCFPPFSWMLPLKEDRKSTGGGIAAVSMALLCFTATTTA